MKLPYTWSKYVIPPVFAGREEELSSLTEVLISEGGNSLIIGPRGIGKTSLLRSWIKSAETGFEERFYIWFHMQRYEKEPIEEFLQDVAQQLCVEVWTRIFKRPFSDLLSASILDTTEQNIDRASAKTIQSIYRILTASLLTGTGDISGEAGGSMVFHGKRGEKKTVKYERKPLRAYEFLRLVEEINEIIKNNGYGSLIIFCDEANHLSDRVNLDILYQYFEVFLSETIQFAFVGIPFKKTNEKEFGTLFSKSIKVSSFTSYEPIKKLISVGLDAVGHGEDDVAEDESLQLILDVTEGYPVIVQHFLYDYFQSRSDPNHISFDTDSLNRFIVSQMNNIQSLTARFRNEETQQDGGGNG